MPALDKKSLSERDICSKFITPALVSAIARNHRITTPTYASSQRARLLACAARQFKPLRTMDSSEGDLMSWGGQ